MDERKNLTDSDFYNQACSYFYYHAEQRTTMINFFIAVFGAAIALYGTLLQIFPIASALVAAFLVVVSVLFFLIDLRNRFDVKQSQSVICQIEKDYGKNVVESDTAYGVFSNEDNTFILYKSAFRKANPRYKKLKTLYKQSLKNQMYAAQLEEEIKAFCAENKKVSPTALKDSLKYAPIRSLSSCIKVLYLVCTFIGIIAFIFSLLIVFRIL